MPLYHDYVQGPHPGFQVTWVGGTHFKKLLRAEGGAKIFGVFRVKSHDFTPKNLTFPILGGMGCPTPPGSAPDVYVIRFWHLFCTTPLLGYPRVTISRPVSVYVRVLVVTNSGLYPTLDVWLFFSCLKSKHFFFLIMFLIYSCTHV